MDAVIRILRYLKASPGKGLMFSKYSHLEINGYTDAYLAGVSQTENLPLVILCL
jgi:hypothetical protein